jgi:hypothetical protein
MGLPAWLTFMIVGFVVMTLLLVVFAIVTVQHHGWGQRRLAPPAVKWFVAAMAVGIVTIGGGVLWPNP